MGEHYAACEYERGGARFVPGVEGYTAATATEAYVEKSVRVGLRRGQSVALDNLGAHKNERPGS